MMQINMAICHNSTMDQYKKVFEAVSGEIDIDTRYSPEEYLEMLSETQIYNADIINMCGGLPHIFSLPKITLSKDRYRGDYIDFVQPSDLDAPMTRGIDPYNRPFISFRCRIRSLQTPDKEDRLEVETMFQRYTDNRHIWAVGGSSHEISMGCTRITGDETRRAKIAERLLRLIHGKPAGHIYHDMNDLGLIESEQRMTDAGLPIVALDPLRLMRQMSKDLQDDIIRSALEMRFRPGNGGYFESLNSFTEISGK